MSRIDRLSRVALFALAAGTGLPAVAADDSPLARLAWLAGCWRADNADAGSVEQWMTPAGGTMFGVGRTVKQGRTVQHEFMQIRERADGKLVYTALPSGQKEASFVQLRLADGDVAFENPEHDFPQRIIYRADGADRLRARIEGQQKGATKGIDFPMTRTRCEAP